MACQEELSIKESVSTLLILPEKMLKILRIVPSQQVLTVHTKLYWMTAIANGIHAPCFGCIFSIVDTHYHSKISKLNHAQRFRDVLNLLLYYRS